MRQASISKGWGTADSAAAQRNYASGEVLAADHILLFTQGLTPAGKTAVKRQIDSIRATVTPENFSTIATGRSQDQGSAVQGGSLGLFQKGAMVPAFERGLLALRPGQISPPIETQYGYHIIRRPTYDQMRDQLLQASKGRTIVVAESTYLAKLEADGKIEIKKEAIPTLRAIGNDPDKYRDDNTVVATSAAGKLTTSRLIG